MKSNLYLALVVTFTLLCSTLAITNTAASVTDFSCGDVSEIPTAECDALVALYNSTNGSGWTDNTHWLITTTPSDWFGVTVEFGHISVLDLHSNQLSGSIPPELGDLSSVSWVDLHSNQLSGLIPPELGDMSNLQYFELSNNQLSGSIPAELGMLNILQYFNLSDNQLNGSIPPELGDLSSLHYLLLSDNQLSGLIPTELANLSSLQSLNLSSNRLIGSIPPELGDLSSLLVLRLDHNQLIGDVPDSFVNLVNLFDPGTAWDGGDGLDLDYNHLNVPPDYPNPANPLHVFLSQKDPDWYLRQTILRLFYLPLLNR
jgi:Leucine-rich repeat (LRR) protein